MKPKTGIALVVAALVGTTSGVVLAVTGQESPVAGPDASPSTPSIVETAAASPLEKGKSPSASKSPSNKSSAAAGGSFGAGVAKENTPLLYVAQNTIHDGENRIEMNDLGDVNIASVDRLAEGYLVGLLRSDTPRDYYSLTIVSASGAIEDLGRTTDNYDINIAKDRIVSVAYDTNRAVVWSSTGNVIGRTAKSAGNMELSHVGFVEDDVAIVSTSFEGNSRAIRWNPDTAKVTKFTPPQLLGLGLSPGGSFIAGNNSQGCLEVTTDRRVNKMHDWQACDWRTFGHQAQFSPDGSQVLAVPAATDGFGPGELAAFAIRADSSQPSGAFATPKLTVDAKWADETHLWVSGARGGDTEFGKGSWIKKCDFGGQCTTVVKTDEGPVTLGGGVY